MKIVSLRLAGAVLATLLATQLATPALAERADRDKPTQIESDRMTSDDARRLSVFEGNVIVRKGTILIRADRISVRQDESGFQISTATGNPASFRQKSEGKDEWIDGEALRIELDDRNEKIELRGRARLTRDKDEVRGDVIAVDTRTEFFSVSGGKSAISAANPEGRVRSVIQPKVRPEDAGGQPAPAQPAARN